MTADWLNILPDNGFTGQTTVYIDAAANEKVGLTRYATVRFTNTEGLYADLQLTQSSNTEDMYATLSPTYIYVQGGGGTFYANINTNTFWRVTNYDSFLNISTENEDGFGDSTIKIVFPANDNSNNWYGYDNNGRPFCGRDGTITIETLAGTKTIYWEQAAYNAITVSPNKLFFPQSGGSMTVTVSSSTDWNITSYDSATTSFSQLSGHSGETVVTVTKSALTQTQIDYYVTKPSTAEFNDGTNVALLFIDSNIDGYFIDDDYVTVTYYVPDDKVNTNMFLFRNISGKKVYYTQNGSLYYNVEPLGYSFPDEVNFQDPYHTTVQVKSDPITWQDIATQAYFVQFTTPGYHQVKYKFPDNTLIQKYMFEKSKDIVKIVVGNKCEGIIAACSVKDVTNCADVILGLGKITSIGEAAFSGCGSYNTDFILTNGVKELLYRPFVDFKAKKFIYDMDYWGGDDSAETKTTKQVSRSVTGGLQDMWQLSIYVASYGYPNRFIGSTSYYVWSNFPGPIACRELVIGQNVKMMYSNGIYPFGYNYGETTSQSVVTYPGLGMYSFTKIASAITCNSLTMLGETPPQTPSGINANLTRTRQTFIVDSDTVYKDFGFAPSSKPFHYPTGRDYSAWLSTFTDNYGDIDI